MPEAFKAYVADPEYLALAPARDAGLRRLSVCAGPALDVECHRRPARASQRRGSTAWAWCASTRWRGGARRLQPPGPAALCAPRHARRVDAAGHAGDDARRHERRPRAPARGGLSSTPPQASPAYASDLSTASSPRCATTAWSATTSSSAPCRRREGQRYEVSATSPATPLHGLLQRHHRGGRLCQLAPAAGGPLLGWLGVLLTTAPLVAYVSYACSRCAWRARSSACR